MNSLKPVSTAICVALLTTSCGLQPAGPAGSGNSPPSEARYRLLNEPECPTTCTAYLLQAEDRVLASGLLARAVDSTAGDDGVLDGAINDLEFEGPITSVVNDGTLLTMTGTVTDENTATHAFNLTFNLTTAETILAVTGVGTYTDQGDLLAVPGICTVPPVPPPTDN